MDTFVENGSQRFRLAEDGRTGLRCRSCGYALKSEDVSALLDFVRWGEPTTCPKCDFTVHELTDFETCFLSSSVQFVNKDVVRSERWFHTTDVANWHDAVTSADDDSAPMVHVGTFESAMQRFSDSYCVTFDWEEPAHWALYELALDDDIEIADDIAPDIDSEAPRSVRTCAGTDYVAHGATRYLNAYEVAGAVSLLVNPKRLRVVSVTELSARDA